VTGYLEEGTINATSAGAAGVRPGPGSPASPATPDPAPGTDRLVGAKASVGRASAPDPGPSWAGAGLSARGGADSGPHLTDLPSPCRALRRALHSCPGWKPHRRDLLDPPKCGEGAWPWPVSCRIRSRSLRTTSGRKFDCPAARDIEVARVLDRGSGDRPRSGRALIVVVEPADLRDRHHTPAPRRLHRAGPGRILLQRLMGSHRVVVPLVTQGLRHCRRRPLRPPD
jgi:hypothetical protein